MANGNNGDGDVFVAANGKLIRRESLEDPGRPGHLRRGLLLGQQQWLAACSFGLKTPRGSSLQLQPTSPDPFMPLADEAPASLRSELTDAEEVLGRAEALCVGVSMKANQAVVALEGFEARYGGRSGGLTPEGSARYNELQAAARGAETEYRATRTLADEARTKFVIAENKMSEWRRRERSRRAEAARLAQKETVKEERSLRDRIAAAFAKQA